ncbi:MAG: sodium-dependent transporter [Opitutales bacterium]|nr:sodium-dependent transporter [Opitutales bacterium]
MRAHFGTRLGVLMATAGSAVGLGNIWRFPTETAKGGGALFLLIYLLCVVFFAIPIILSEFTVGREGRANPAASFANLGGGRFFYGVGLLSVIVLSMISCFYMTVAGWACEYLRLSFAAIFSQDTAFFSQPDRIFNDLLANPSRQALWIIVSIFATSAILWKGVRQGIELASKIMMPLLFVILLVMVFRAVTLPGAVEGLKFFFAPDFSKLNSTIVLAALGQSFFSLSCGMAILIVYSSYFSRREDLIKTASGVAVLDTLVAILAGIIIFCTAFAAGGDGNTEEALLKGGPGLIFVTLPSLFNTLPLGTLCSVLFFTLLVLATLTSSISMFEGVLVYFSEKLDLPRKKVIIVMSLVFVVVNIVAAISLTESNLQWHEKSVFDWLDYLTSEWMMPVVSFFTSVFVGWVLDKKILMRSFEDRPDAVPVLLFFVRFVVPAGIFFILASKFF